LAYTLGCSNEKVSYLLSNMVKDMKGWVLTKVETNKIFEPEIDYYFWKFCSPEIGFKLLYNLSNIEHSRLRFLPDKAKTRMVAVCDIYSQSLLERLHGHFNSYLKTHFKECDATFDQNAHRDQVRDMTYHGGIFYSFDLESCTDRLPRKVQRDILVWSGVLLPSQGDAWLGMTENRVFNAGRSKIRKRKLFSGIVTERKVKYSVGTPIGILSIWPAMAITHHLIIRFCDFLVTKRIHKFSSYRILGDDIVIRNNSLSAGIYKRFMTKILGVGINISKSMAGESICEFAKCIYHKGREIKPIPYSCFRPGNGYYITAALDLCKELSRKEWRLIQFHIVPSLYPGWKQNVLIHVLLSPINEGKRLFEKTFVDVITRKFQVTKTEYLSWCLRKEFEDFFRHASLKEYRDDWIKHDTGQLARHGYFNPFLQVAIENESNFPIKLLDAPSARSASVIAGNSWIAFDSNISTYIRSSINRLITKPGPSYKKSLDDHETIRKIVNFQKEHLGRLAVDWDFSSLRQF
jgi:hypothetical protein